MKNCRDSSEMGEIENVKAAETVQNPVKQIKVLKAVEKVLKK